MRKREIQDEKEKIYNGEKTRKYITFERYEAKPEKYRET